MRNGFEAKYVWLAQGTARRPVWRGISERESRRVRGGRGSGDYDGPERTCPVQMGNHYLDPTSCYHLGM